MRATKEQIKSALLSIANYYLSHGKSFKGIDIGRELQKHKVGVLPKIIVTSIIEANNGVVDDASVELFLSNRRKWRNESKKNIEPQPQPNPQQQQIVFSPWDGEFTDEQLGVLREWADMLIRIGKGNATDQQQRP